jgi:hypothetical protein
MARSLGRTIPPDFDHVAKYPLSALAPQARPTHVPVAVGVNWYTSFDSPVQGADGRWRIPASNLGTVRGGHCFCLEPAPQPGQPGGEQEARPWWTYYNQGEEGACEGFGHARVLTLLYRKTFDAFWLYDDARRAEGAYPNGEGSTNRACCQALVKWGAHYEIGAHCKRTPWRLNVPGVRIAAYRWATTAQEVLDALGIVGEEIPFLNSWGTEYPERVLMPAVTLERLLKENGEADVLIER